MKKFFTFFTSILITATAFSQDLPTYIPTDGLALYYPFSANANDASGNQNHGIVTNAQLTADRFGNENSAYTFDGDDDYITSTNAFGGGQIPMTFSFWAKTSQANSRMSVMTQDCNSDESCSSSFGLVLNKFLNSAVVCNDGHMGTSPQSFGYAQSAHYGTVRAETANSGWNNYVLVIGSNDNYIYNNFKFYVNGSELQTNCDHNWDSWDYNFPSGFSLVIGKGNQTIIENFFDGEIDDVAIWNRALSNEEIYSLYDLPADILLNGTVSAENNQIKNVSDPTDDQDAATKNYVDNNLGSFSGSYNDLTDTPTMYTQAQVDELISNLQTQMDALTPPQGTAAINHNNKTYSGVSCEGFWLGFKFSVSDTQTITALGAWDEGHNIEVNDEFSSCPEASNFSVPIAIYKNDVLVLEKVINASIGFVIGNSRYIKIDDFVLTPGDEYFIIGNYEGSSKFGYFDSNLVTTDYDSRITPLTVTSSPLFSKNTNGDGTFPSNLTTLSDNQWSDQYFHVNFLLKD
tara:strand:- start:280 stop:1830 length:1551 start_codon:yes stop_codon:yes gene_type:complete